MKGISVRTERNYSPGVELRAEDQFDAELIGFGTTVSVELKDWKFRITGPRFVATIPACPCERTPCVGARWDSKCTVKADGHHRTHCHRFSSGAHAEHVMVLAEEVLKTYRDKGKVPSRLVGCGSDYRHGSFLPLPGQECVSFTADPIGNDGWSVVCDAARCRDKAGRVVRLSTHGTEHEARSAVERHKGWHAGQRGETYLIPEAVSA